MKKFKLIFISFIFFLLAVAVVSFILNKNFSTKNVMESDPKTSKESTHVIQTNKQSNGIQVPKDQNQDQKQKLPYSPLVYLGLDSNHMNYLIDGSKKKTMSAYSHMTITYFQGDPQPYPIRKDKYLELPDGSVSLVSTTLIASNGMWGPPSQETINNIELPGNLYVGESWNKGDSPYKILNPETITTLKGEYQNCLVVSDGSMYYYYYPHVGLVTVKHLNDGNVDYFTTIWDSKKTQ